MDDQCRFVPSALCPQPFVPSALGPQPFMPSALCPQPCARSPAPPPLLLLSSLPAPPPWRILTAPRPPLPSPPSPLPLQVLAHPDCILSLRVHSPTVNASDRRCGIRSSAKCFQRAHLENMFSSRAHVPPESITFVGEWFAKVVGTNAEVGFTGANVTVVPKFNHTIT